MKIKITEIEASAEELRQSSSLADGMTRMIRNIFSPYYFSVEEDNDEDEQTEGSD